MSEANRQVPTPEMPQYHCHKKVRALQIDRIETGAERIIDGFTVFFVDPAYPPKAIRAAVFARGLPQHGDYMVKYDDGYWSWSPRKAFEEGYTRI